VTPFLRTERLYFRPWAAGDWPLALALWADPAVTRLVADLGDPSESQARARLKRELAHQEAHGFQYWPIFLHEGVHAGCCGLRPHRPGVPEIGVHLFPHLWGRGLATEALAAVVGYAFGRLAARGLFARHHPRNHGSARVLARLGFHHTHDEVMPQTGLPHPCYLLAAAGNGAGGKGEAGEPRQEGTCPPRGFSTFHSGIPG
jgi:ribosomal-protein-alanine N-acetyltransferase